MLKPNPHSFATMCIVLFKSVVRARRGRILLIMETEFMPWKFKECVVGMVKSCPVMVG